MKEKWTLENCIEDAKQYESRGAWYKGNPSAYNAALRKGFMEACCEVMPDPFNGKQQWTLEHCIEDAKKYKSRGAWYKGNPSAYNAALRKGYMDDCFEHVEKPEPQPEPAQAEPKQRPRRIKWTKERCIEDAKRFTSRSEWKKASNSAYNSARHNDWLDECTTHMGVPATSGPRKAPTFWDLESCKQDALHYATPSEWSSGNRSAYTAACRHDWLAECCGHMVKSSASQRMDQLRELAFAEAANYETPSQMEEADPFAYAVLETFDWIGKAFGDSTD